MKLKHLQSALSSVPTPQFPSPHIALEQYGTSPVLTSHVIHAALSREDIGPTMSVCDLGSGTGMLGIGSAIVGCSLVICVDCDESAMEIARDNFVAMEIEHSIVDDVYDGDDCGDGEDGCRVEYVLAKVRHESAVSNQRKGDGGRGRGGRGRGRGRRGKVTRTQRQIMKEGIDKGQSESLPNDSTAHPDTNVDESSTSINNHDGIPLLSNCVDTVLTNPPFGTKNNAGVDITFLRAATRLARRAVYSFHKSSTRDYLVKTVKGWGYEVEVVAQMKFDIPKLYKFHKKDNVDIEVDLIRVILI